MAESEEPKVMRRREALLEQERRYQDCLSQVQSPDTEDDCDDTEQ